MLDGGEWLPLCLCHFTPRERCAEPRANLDGLKKTQITNFCHNKTLDHPVCSLATIPTMQLTVKLVLNGKNLNISNVTDSMEQSAIWEVNTSSTGRGISLQKLKLYYCVHNNPPMNCILCQKDSSTPFHLDLVRYCPIYA